MCVYPHIYTDTLNRSEDKILTSFLTVKYITNTLQITVEIVSRLQPACLTFTPLIPAKKGIGWARPGGDRGKPLAHSDPVPWSASLLGVPGEHTVQTTESKRRKLEAFQETFDFLIKQGRCKGLSTFSSPPPPSDLHKDVKADATVATSERDRKAENRRENVPEPGQHWLPLESFIVCLSREK